LLFLTRIFMPAAFSTETTLALACHPDAPDAAVQGITVSLTRAPEVQAVEIT